MASNNKVSHVRVSINFSGSLQGRQKISVPRVLFWTSGENSALDFYYQYLLTWNSSYINFSYETNPMLISYTM